MIRHIHKIIFSSTSKDSIYLLAGTVISTLLNFFIVYLLTQNLSTGQFGLFITAISFSLLLTDILALGIGASVLNFIPKSGEADRGAYIKSAFIIRVSSYLVLCGVVVILAPVIATVFFNDPTISAYISISSIGIILLAVILLGQIILQSMDRFLAGSILNTSMNVFRAFVILFFIWFGYKSSINLYFGFNVALIASFVLLVFFLRLDFIKVSVTKAHFANLLKFGLPIGASFAVAAVYTKLDQLLVFNLAGEKEAGVYGLAFRIASIFIFLTDALNQAIVPRFVALSDSDYKLYFKKSLMVIFFLGFLIALTIPLTPIIVPLLFGPAYSESVLPLQILTVGMIFFTLSTPLTLAIIFRMKKNLFPFYLSISSLILIYILLNILIPIYQSVGAALSVTIVYFCNLIVSFGFYQFFGYEKK